MLILVLRMGFIALSMLVGFTSGHYFYDHLFIHMPPWFGATIGYGVAVTLIAAEHAFRRKFARSLIAFLVGLGAGLALSWLVLSVISLVVQDRDFYNNLDMPVALITTYLVMITVLHNIDRWRLVIPFVEFRSTQVHGGPLVVDGTILGDSRLLGLLRTGIITENVLIHRRVLDQLENQAHDQDPALQARARRSLDGAKEIRALTSPPSEIDDTELPNAERLDDLLVRLCRLENARLASNNRELLRRAEAEGVRVIDLAALASLLVPQVRAGEVITLTIEKVGEGKGQGVGFLDDGSMVVVGDCASRLGESLLVTVLRTLATANGRMVFAELAKPEAPAGAGAGAVASTAKPAPPP
jgi:uncharacterized protein YacL